MRKNKKETNKKEEEEEEEEEEQQEQEEDWGEEFPILYIKTPDQPPQRPLC